jgi:hypothetical protein
MAKRRNSLIVGEITVHHCMHGLITYAEATLNRGGKIFAYARKSERDGMNRTLAAKVVQGRIHEALRQHKLGGKITVRFAGYEAPLKEREVERQD